MSTWSRLEKGAYFTAEQSLAVLPKAHKFDNTRMGVIYAHGFGGDALEGRDAVSKTGLYNILDVIADNGNPVVACDFGGQIWGNDTAIARMTSAVAFLKGALGAKAGKVALIGQSMGHVTVMNWAAQNMAQVACVVGNIPVCDLQDIYGQATYTASINAAYGGSYVDSSNGVAHNPLKMANAAQFAGLPWKGYTIADDVVATYAKVGAMGTAIGATASVVTLAGTGGHDWPTVAKIDPQAVLAFLKANGA